jgi:hypothetical protein
VPARLKNNQEQWMRPTTARHQKERHKTIAREFHVAVAMCDTRHQGAIGIFNVPVDMNGKQKGDCE